MRTLLSILTVLLALATASRADMPLRQTTKPADPRQDPGWELGHTRWVHEIAYSRDGKIVVSAGEDGSIRWWNAENGALLKTLLGDATDAKAVHAVQFSPDGATLAGCGEDKQVHLWSVPEGRLLHTFSGHRKAVSILAWSPHGDLLASAGDDKQVFLWNPVTGEHRSFPIPISVPYTLAFSPDGKTLAVSGYSETQGSPEVVDLYDVQTGQPQENWLTRLRFHRMTVSQNGSLVAVYETNGRTTLRDGSTGQIRQTFQGGVQDAPSIVFSPEGTKFLVLFNQPATNMKLAQWWDLTQNAPLSGKFAVGYREAHALSPEGRKFAATETAHRNRVFVCDCLTGRELWASADPSLILGSKPGLALLQQLLEDYRTYALPELPKSASLAYLEPVNPQGPQTPQWYLAFVLPPDHPGGKTVFYKGLRSETVGAEQAVLPVTPEQASLKDTANAASTRASFDNNIVTAIQMQERGWTPLALEFLGRALTDYRGEARHDLAAVAWRYWEQTLAQPDTDRHNALSSLRTLSQTGFLPEGARKRAFVADLEASLAPSHATPGSIEAEIDALVDFRENDHGLSLGALTARPDLSKADLRFNKLWLRGFEAVPVLLQYTEDRRLTRTAVQSMGGRGGEPNVVRIGQVVAALLAGLAGRGEVVGIHWQEQRGGLYADRAIAELWWKQARAVGEEKYLLRHVLPEENNDRSWPNAHNAVLIAAKYPRRLPDLYKEALDRYPRAQNWQLTELLAQSSLPNSVKSPLLLRAATSGDAQQRLAAFWQLVAMKRPEAAQIVIGRLDRLPATPPGTYWQCEAGKLALIVQVLDNPPTWDALERLAKRSDVGQRLEILSELGKGSPEGEHKRHQIAFLAKFVQDQTLRVVPKHGRAGSSSSAGKYEGAFADYDRDRITVQDAALRHLSVRLGIEPPDSRGTQAEWAAWRKTTLQALHTYIVTR